MKEKICIVGIFFIGLCHVAVTALYLFPVNPLTKYYINAVNNYMEPLFEQRWQLFAPEPALDSLKFWYRCGDDGKNQTPWLDPSEPILRRHYRWRVTSSGKLLYVYDGIARGFYNSYLRLAKETCSEEQRQDPSLCIPKIYGELKDDVYYRSAKKLAKQECQKHVASGVLTKVGWIQFQATKIYPKQFSQRESKTPFARIEYLRAPQEEVGHDS